MDVKDEWELISAVELSGHKITRFKFKSREESMLGKIKTHRIKEIHAIDENQAWRKLKESEKNKL